MYCMIVNSKNDSPPAFVLGGGVNGLGAVRTLAKLGARVVIFDKDPTNIAFSSRFASARYTVPACSADAGESIRKVARSFGVKPVLVITSDFFLGMVDSEREAFQELCTFVLPPSSAVQVVLDKKNFNEFAWKTDLGIARGITVDSHSAGEENDRKLELIEMPVLVKPTASGFWTTDGSTPQGGSRKDKAIVFSEKAKFLRFLAENPTLSVVVQEYIPGGDDEQYSLMCYRDANGRVLTAFGVRKLRLSPIRNGVAALASLSDDPELFSNGLKIVGCLGYSGISSVCFKRSSVTGKLVCYEVNGRLPLSHRAGSIVGRSLVESNYLDACGIPIQTAIHPIACNRYWQSIVGDMSASISYWRNGELSISSWFNSLVKVRHFAEFQWNDPFPCFASIYRLFVKSC